MTTEERNKMEILLLDHFSIFHTDMLLRAIQDDDISLSQFIKGYKSLLTELLEDDSDEFVPDEFFNV